MSSLVLELQRAALDANTEVRQLLLMAKVISVKLDLESDLAWINDELEGYSDYDRMPDYRRAFGRIKAKYPMHGWQTIQFEDVEIEDVVCRHPMLESIAHLSELASRGVAENSTVNKSLPRNVLDLLYSQMSLKLEVQAFIDPSALTHIIETVRSKLLDWALSLEKRGIFGADMTFSDQEKQKAAAAGGSISIGHIGIFNGSLGGVVHTQHITATNFPQMDYRSQVTAFLSGLGDKLRDQPVEEAADIVTAAQLVKTELEQPEPDETRIKKALRAVGAAATGLTSWTIQAAINAEIGKIIAPGH
jgi:hypothetical protein